MIYVWMQAWIRKELLSKESGQVFGPIPLKLAEKQSWSLGKWNALSLNYLSRATHTHTHTHKHTRTHTHTHTQDNATRFQPVKATSTYLALVRACKYALLFEAKQPNSTKALNIFEQWFSACNFFPYCTIVIVFCFCFVFFKLMDKFYLMIKPDQFTQRC